MKKALYFIQNLPYEFLFTYSNDKFIENTFDFFC